MAEYTSRATSSLRYRVATEPIRVRTCNVATSGRHQVRHECQWILRAACGRESRSLQVRNEVHARQQQPARWR